MKTLYKRLKLQYLMWKYPLLKGLVRLDPRYVIPSTWEDCLQTSADIEDKPRIQLDLESGKLSVLPEYKVKHYTFG